MTFQELFDNMMGNAGGSILGIAANGIAARHLAGFDPAHGYKHDEVPIPEFDSVTLTLYVNPLPQGPKWIAA